MTNETLVFFWFDKKKLSSQSGPKGCFWNFFRLPSHDFAAYSPIDFAASSPPYNSWYLGLVLSVRIMSKALMDKTIQSFSHQKMLKNMDSRSEGNLSFEQIVLFYVFMIKNFLGFSNILYFHLRFTSRIYMFFFYIFCWKTLKCHKGPFTYDVRHQGGVGSANFWYFLTRWRGGVSSFLIFSDKGCRGGPAYSDLYD